MTTDQQTTTEPRAWGASPTPGPPRRRKTAAVVGVAAAIAVAGGVTVYATTSGSDSTTTQGPGAGAAPGGAGGPMGAGVESLHGTYTVADDSGTGYHTEVTQTGEVTAISATSITVLSADDYTKTYPIGSDTVVQAMDSTAAGAPGSGGPATATLDTIAKGDQVTLTAAESGTVDTITEQTGS